MPKPTKFDLMRARREKTAKHSALMAMVRDFQPGPLQVYRDPLQLIADSLAELVKLNEPDVAEAAPSPAPAAPVMEVDGVLYREAPEERAGSCKGCAFQPLGSCKPMREAGRAAFGKSCADGDRDVVYVKA